MFVKVNKANQVVQYPYTMDMFRSENRNVSLPENISNRLLEKYFIFPVTVTEMPDYNQETQTVAHDSTPLFVDGQWIISWAIAEKPAGQIEYDNMIKGSEIRKIRDELLSTTDWVSIRAIDTGTSVSEEWIAYRMGLRDITSQSGFPWNISWPKIPSGV